MSDHARRLRMMAKTQQGWADRCRYQNMQEGYRADAAALLAGAEALEREERLLKEVEVIFYDSEHKYSGAFVYDWLRKLLTAPPPEEADRG